MRIVGLFSFILFSVRCGTAIYPDLHSPDHFQLGDEVEQFLILGLSRFAFLGFALAVLHVLLGLFQGFDHFLEGIDNVFLDGDGHLAGIDDLKAVLDEIKRYIPKATVWAFGSRVDGTCRQSSDLDLAVHCDKETALKELPKLNERLIESDLPFKVQLLDYDRLPENMQGNIKEKYVVLYGP